MNLPVADCGNAAALGPRGSISRSRGERASTAVRQRLGESNRVVLPRRQAWIGSKTFVIFLTANVWGLTVVVLSIE